ncbi:ThuA domain-containing protein [Roseibacillus persicicus]|uniref:ThuA domain-containing protein n=1 Tax=Roseibacillus persicicus TaxID=454148 RepID=UPI00280C998C|nr:ThuA domain-containing protein [Roseibacillus persicicus]MDQ8190270.1 ThuA domain-containing protein [Roseibacillus persicicus]
MKRIVFFLLSLVLSLFAEEQKPPRLLIVTGEPEYGSHETMARLGSLLKDEHGFAVTHLRAKQAEGEGHHIPGLSESLGETDLLLFYVRFLVLPAEEVKALGEYFDKGGAFIAVRTSTHPFRYPEGSELEDENESFPVRYFGTSYRGHHGHQTSQINFVMALDHPIMRGVDLRFWTPDFLYGTNPLSGQVTPPMIGQGLDGVGRAKLEDEEGEGFLKRNHCRTISEGDASRITGTPHPVAWTIENEGRGFVSTIGARESFANPSVVRLYLNAAFWCLGREEEIPAKGLFAK